MYGTSLAAPKWLAQGSLRTIFDFPRPVHFASARTHREELAAQGRGLTRGRRDPATSGKTFGRRAGHHVRRQQASDASSRIGTMTGASERSSGHVIDSAADTITAASAGRKHTGTVDIGSTTMQSVISERVSGRTCEATQSHKCVIVGRSQSASVCPQRQTAVSASMHDCIVGASTTNPRCRGCG